MALPKALGITRIISAAGSTCSTQLHVWTTQDFAGLLTRAWGRDLKSKRLRSDREGGGGGAFLPSHPADVCWQRVLLGDHMTRCKQICLEFTHSHVPLGTIHLCKHCHFFVLSVCVNVPSCMPVFLSRRHGKCMQIKPGSVKPDPTYWGSDHCSVPEIQGDVLHLQSSHWCLASPGSECKMQPLWVLPFKPRPNLQGWRPKVQSRASLCAGSSVGWSAHRLDGQKSCWLK